MFGGAENIWLMLCCKKLKGMVVGAGRAAQDWAAFFIYDNSLRL